jgi:hypothetical protein
LYWSIRFFVAAREVELRKSVRKKAPLWDSMVARYNLLPTPYEQVANWAFVDFMLNFAEETVLRTIKIRQAGFADCIDTHKSFTRQLSRLSEMRIIP